MISFRDIFKSAFLEMFRSSAVSEQTIIRCMFVAVLLGAYIFFLYPLVTRKTFYDKYFNMSLPVVAVIVCAIVLTIQSNIVVSLGMVGALSIVRFRTAVKAPMDLVFIFWAIAVGIICGAALHMIALIMSAVITVGLFIMEVLPVAKVPVLLVINAQSKDCRQNIMEILQSHTKRYHIKSETIETTRLNMIIEIRCKNSSLLLSEIAQIPSISRCSLVNHDGETTF